MISDQFAQIAEEKVRQLAATSETQVWAVLASLWIRNYVLAARAWERWPQIHETMKGALEVALQRSIGCEPSRVVVQHLKERMYEQLDGEQFDPGEDYADEGTYIVDLGGMIDKVLDGESATNCLAAALETYLETAFTMLVNELAESRGGTIMHREAEAILAENGSMEPALAFVRAL